MVLQRSWVSLFVLLGMLASLVWAQPPTDTPPPIPAGPTYPIGTPTAGELPPPLHGQPAPIFAPSPAGSTEQDPPVPVVALRLRGPVSATLGQEISYKIYVENHARADAHQVTVRNIVPANARYVSAQPEPTGRAGNELVWQIGTLLGCHYKEITLVLISTDGTDIRNCAKVQFEHGQCVTTRLGGQGTLPVPRSIPTSNELSIVKRGPTKAWLDEVLLYEIVVTNNTRKDALSVRVADSLDAGLRYRDGEREGGQQRFWNLGDLKPGDSRRIEYQVVAKQIGKQCNKVVLVDESGRRTEASSCVNVLAREKPAGVETGVGKLSIRKFKVGGQENETSAKVPTVFRIEVRNLGTGPLTNVEVVDQIPPKTRFHSASSGAVLSADQVRWALGTMSAGDTRILQVVFQALEEGVLQNTVVGFSSAGIRVEDKVALTVRGAPAGVTYYLIDEQGGKLQIGMNTQYSITVLNQGANDVTNVKLVVTIPDELKFVKSEPPALKQEGNKLIFDAFTLRKESDARYRVEVTGQRIEVGGRVSTQANFEADLSADGVPRAVKQQPTLLYEPEPSLR